MNTLFYEPFVLQLVDYARTKLREPNIWLWIRQRGPSQLEEKHEDYLARNLGYNLKRVYRLVELEDFTRSHYMYNRDRALERIERYIHAFETKKPPVCRDKFSLWQHSLIMCLNIKKNGFPMDKGIWDTMKSFFTMSKRSQSRLGQLWREFSKTMLYQGRSNWLQIWCTNK